MPVDNVCKALFRGSFLEFGMFEAFFAAADALMQFCSKNKVEINKPAW